MIQNNRVNENNRVTLSGYIASEFVFDHEIFGEGIYTANLEVARTSGTVDTIQLQVSERLVDVTKNCIGNLVEVFGSFRSRNINQGSRTKLLLYVFVTDIHFIDQLETEDNAIVLNGYICKQPIHRVTPRGKYVTDILLAVQRAYSKSDYIPCIVWGRNAGFAANLAVGTHIRIEGRIQSREYVKYLNKQESVTRIAYEVSGNSLKVLN